MDLDTLKTLLPEAWCAETAFGEWTPSVPSMNQCAITALVVQDYLGGELLRCPLTNGTSHYWNLLPDNTEADLTADQFRYILPKPLKAGTIIRTREYVLSYPETVKRYQLLKSRLEALMTEKGIS